MIEKDQLVPGWWFSYEELSAGHYVLTGRDQHGHSISCDGAEVSKLLETGRDYAVNIALQISRNKQKFLYEYLRLRLGGDNITESRYEEKVFGSWIIHYLNRRIVLDGKESLLIVEVQNDGIWEEIVVEDIRSITPEKLNGLVNKTEAKE